MSLPPGKSRKSARLRLAKAELLLGLAVTASRWADQDTGLSSADLFEKLSYLYDLSDADLSRLCEEIADQLEQRALRAGYEEA